MIENRTVGAKVFDGVNAVVLIIATLLCLIPLWYILMVSLSDKTAVNAGIVSFWPIGFNTLSYRKIMGETEFLLSFWVSVKRVVLGGLLGLSCTFLTAYPLSKTKKQFPRRDIFMWVLIFSMLFQGGTIPWYLTIRRYGLMDSIWALVLAGGLPVFNVIMAMNFFRNLPTALEEAAYIDGTGPWKTFFLIFIPLSKPIIATIALFTIVGHWNEFFQGLVLMNQQRNYPLQTYIQQMVVTKDLSNLASMSTEEIELMTKLNNKSLDAAKIFIAMVPILLVYPFLQKYFITGITLGSVKE